METRTQELRAYYEFYGYEVCNPAAFATLMRALLAESKCAENNILSLKELDHKFKWAQKENVYKAFKALDKDYSGLVGGARGKKKSKKVPRYFILNRVVTPLVLANERVIESFLRHAESPPATDLLPSPEVLLQESIQRMSILDDDLPELQMQRKPSKSLNIKRSYMEMQRIASGPSDLFSVAALKAIFAHIDYEALKFDNLSCIAVSHFAAIVFEIRSSELHSVNSRVEAEMGLEDVSLRVIKPYKQFYDELVAVALRYGVANLPSVDVADFVDAAQHSMGSLWQKALREPTEAFYAWCTAEAAAVGGKGELAGWFEGVKCRMAQAWEADVIQRASDFRKAKKEQN